MADEQNELTRLKAENEELKKQLACKDPARKRLPDTRKAVVHKFSIAGHEGYLIVGVWENGTPAEVFITMAKEGSTIGGLMDTIGRLTSMALQYGVPVHTLCDKFKAQKFEPSGYTENSQIKMAASIVDYIYRWLDLNFCEECSKETGS